jgi:hypothetical protein
MAAHSPHSPFVGCEPQILVRVIVPVWKFASNLLNQLLDFFTFDSIPPVFDSILVFWFNLLITEDIFESTIQFPGILYTTYTLSNNLLILFSFLNQLLNQASGTCNIFESNGIQWHTFFPYQFLAFRLLIISRRRSHMVTCAASTQKTRVRISAELKKSK